MDIVTIIVTTTVTTIIYSLSIMCQSLFRGPPASQWENTGQKLVFPFVTVFILNTGVSEGHVEKPDNFECHPP